MRDHGLAHQERALEIDVEHEVPGLFRHFPEQAAISAVRCGGVVDEHVDVIESGERLLDEALGVGGATHVTDECEHASADLLDLLREALEALPAETDFLQPFLVLVPRAAACDVGRDDVGARARERDRDRAADPARPRTPGDQHDLSIEFAHRRALLARDDGMTVTPSAQGARPTRVGERAPHAQRSAGEHKATAPSRSRPFRRNTNPSPAWKRESGRDLATRRPIIADQESSMGALRSSPAAIGELAVP